MCLSLPLLIVLGTELTVNGTDISDEQGNLAPTRCYTQNTLQWIWTAMETEISQCGMWWNFIQCYGMHSGSWAIASTLRVAEQVAERLSKYHRIPVAVWDTLCRGVNTGTRLMTLRYGWLGCCVRGRRFGSPRSCGTWKTNTQDPIWDPDSLIEFLLWFSSVISDTFRDSTLHSPRFLSPISL
jgi:hypothetical protein